MLKRLRSWLAVRLLLMKARRSAAGASAGLAAAEEKLAKLKRRYDAIDRRLWTLGGKVSAQLERMESLRKQWEESLEAERQQRELLEKMVLPLLTNENELARQRLERWIAMENRGKVALGPVEEGRI